MALLVFFFVTVTEIERHIPKLYHLNNHKGEKL